MGKTPLRRLFPSVAVSPVGLAAMLRVEWLPGVKLPCPKPECTTDHVEPTIATVPDPAGGWWSVCSSCGWAGSLFELYLEHTQLSPAAGLRALKRAGHKVRRGCLRPVVLAEWDRHVRARKTLAQIHHKFETRALAGPLHGHGLALTGTTQMPHRPPLWWATSAGEIGPLVGNLLAPASAAFRRLGAATPDELHTPTVVIPLHDALRRLTGIVGYSAHTAGPWYYTRTLPGSVSMGFLHTAEQRVPRLGDVGLLTTCPTTALSIICTYLRDHPGPPPVVFIPPEQNVTKVVAALPRRPWTFVSGIGAYTRGMQGYELDIARRVGAKFATYGHQSTVEAITHTIWAAMPWEHRFEAIFVDANDLAARELLHLVRWSSVLRNQLISKWRSRSIDRADYLWQSRESRQNAVSAAPGLTIVETVAGWVWCETGELLAAAYPTNVTVTRAAPGRIVYQGVVCYQGHQVPFRSARFAVDPVGVVTAALLRAGHSDVPPFHPRVVPHITHASVYLSRPPLKEPS